MQKEKYVSTELEIIKFQTADVILNSGLEYEDDEVPLVQNID